MSKILNILINEDPNSMKIGINTSLLYALTASTTMNLSVNFIRVDENINFPDQIESVYSIDPQSSKMLLNEYQIQNQQIRDKALILKQHITFSVDDFLKNKSTSIVFVKKITDIEYIKSALEGSMLNRVEPMKAPFPPQGNRDINQFLKKLIANYSYIHAPLNLCDKEFIKNLSIPTQEIKTHLIENLDIDIVNAIKNIIDEYRRLYPYKENYRIVIKPKNSAQSLGVFAIEFVKNSNKNFNINSDIITNSDKQIIYCDKDVLSNSNLLIQIIKKSLQTHCPQNKTIEDFYGKEILVQPYLEGIELGDFRAIIMKNKNNKFEYFGSIFRKKFYNSSNLNNFTTCASSGQSIPSQLGQFKIVIDKFVKQILIYLHVNEEKYQQVHFVGADIIAKEINFSDETLPKLFLGEINMHCPALISLLKENLSQVINTIIKPQIDKILKQNQKGIK